MPSEDLDAVHAWAASGAMGLTGRPGARPIGPPAPLVPGLAELAVDLTRRAKERNAALDLDPLQLLVDRAAITGYSRGGDVSCGGQTRLLRCGDGWIAVSLARDDDRDAVPAWLELGSRPSDPWAVVSSEVRSRATAELVARARLLGLPVAALPDPRQSGGGGHPLVTTSTIQRRARRPADGALRVVDLSSLWAGPLCSKLLQQLGARVIKVEAARRPDGTRRGPRAFFDLLNGGKESVVLDFRSPHDVEVLRQLLATADVVIEASRPRALEQLGIVAADLLASGTAVWASITGYGRAAPGRDWVAFGDDAAVAGGLVVFDRDGPCFCADAVADPLTGLVAASAVLGALEGDDTVLLDVAMARVAAHFAGPTLPAPEALEPRAPTPRRAADRGPELGEHNDAVLAELAQL